MMFDEGPDHTGRPFRSKGELSAAPVFEHVHFLLYDIGGFTERSLKKVDGFKRRGANFLIAEALKEGAGLRFEMLELRSISGPARRSFSEGGKDVLGAANGLILRHG